jgi:hypothetical protein
MLMPRDSVEGAGLAVALILGLALLLASVL